VRTKVSTISAAVLADACPRTVSFAAPPWVEGPCRSDRPRMTVALIEADDRQRADPADRLEEGIVMMYYGDHMNGWGWFAMSVGTILFWGLVITAIVLLVRNINKAARPSQSPRTPEQLLAERFARGEIDETEYQQRLATLQEHARH
jgi:putative membrane protein